MQILPSEFLFPYIKHYLFLESGEYPYRALRLFSDGNTGMVFLFNQGRLSINHNQYLPSSFLYGQISHFQDLSLIEKASFIIIVFQPDGFYKLLGISARELRDQIISTQDLFGQSAQKLYDHLLHLKKSTDKVNTLNNFFYDLALQRKSPSHNLLPTVLRHIAYKKGLVTVEQIVQYSGYTERHIERLFAEQIGMGPKKFGNIVQLHSFLKLLRNKAAEISLTTICYESGYFDQSHLIRAFKKYTGVTTSDYLNSTNRLAINFMEFKDGAD